MAKSSAACPICRKPAKHTTASAGDNTEIDCRDCGHFQVSGSFQETVSRQSIVVRRQSLDRARIRARYGSLPIITTYDLP